MYKKAFWLVFGLTSICNAYAQTTYLPIGGEDQYLLDRLETKSGILSNELYLYSKPISRKAAVHFLSEQTDSISLSKVDRYDISQAISVSGEWTEDGNGAIDSKKPWFHTLYKKQPDFIYTHTKDFFVAINPVITLQEIRESSSNKFLFTSSRGGEARGLIANRIGFYTFLADNQEMPPGFISTLTDNGGALPGADNFRKNKNGSYDYLLARGYIDFAAIKDHINISFGYDKHFWGDGMNSLVLSDISAPHTFLGINTHVWKFNYQNLYMELVPQFKKTGTGGDHLLPHKYAAIHRLGFNIASWMNIGLFESVIFDRRDRFEFSYMVPLILYREIERSLGSPDNILLGFDFKALAAKHLQFYGQFLLDEFTSKELVAGKGYWANKFGLQLGFKYFDAFGTRNLDLQGEVNLVRPYTYTHYDSTANYTHYNQPLAHPLGAGFIQLAGQAKYHGIKNLYLSLKGMYYQKSTDTGTANYGGDIFKDYDSRSMSYGVHLVNGVKAQCALLNFTASYELKKNLFFDLGVTHRVYAYENGILPTQRTTYFLAGVRLNFIKRNYDIY